MALTGRFEADFESFYQAVDKADAKMADFQSGAGRVESSLNRMVDSFSGVKIIQQATLAAEAIERLGGSSKLTEAELQSAAAKAAEAVQKFQALGVAAPESIANLAAQLKPAKEEMSLLGEVTAEIGPIVAGAFTVEKIVEFALNVGKAEQDMTRLSNQTQINTDDLQDLTSATQEYGLSNEELAKSLYNVAKGIAGGDASVSVGLHEIGLSLDDVKDKHGKELFLDIEDGLSKLQGGLRDTAAADIFGAKLGSAMAGFSSKAREATEAAAQFNAKLSPAEIAQLKAYADEVDHLERNLGTLKDKILGGVAGAINGITDANKQGVSWWKLASDGALDYLQSMLGLGPGLRVMNEVTAAAAKAAAAQKAAGTAAADAVEPLSKEAEAAIFLEKTRLDSVKALEPYQQRALEDLRQMGQLNEKNAAGVGVTIDQFKKYTEEVRQTDTVTKSLTDSTLANEKAVQKVADAYEALNAKLKDTQTDQELDDIKRRLQADIDAINQRAIAQKAALAATHADTKEALDAIDADTKNTTDKIKSYYAGMAADVGVDYADITKNTHAYLQDQADRALKTLIDAEFTVGETRNHIEELRAKYVEAQDAARNMGATAVAANQAATAAVDKHVSALDAELAALDAIDKKNAQAFSREYDLSTNSGRQQFLKDNPGASIGVGPDWFKEQGHTLAEAIADGLVTFANSGQLGDAFKLGGIRNSQTSGSAAPDPFATSAAAASGGSSAKGAGSGLPPAIPAPPNAPSQGTQASAGLGFQLSRPGAGTGASPPGSVHINAPIYVSGVFDPASSHALSVAVGTGIMDAVSNGRVLH
jgi:hypothetical protein